jgi:hypothetical protein
MQGISWTDIVRDAEATLRNALLDETEMIAESLQQQMRALQQVRELKILVPEKYRRLLITSLGGPLNLLRANRLAAQPAAPVFRRPEELVRDWDDETAVVIALASNSDQVVEEQVQALRGGPGSATEREELIRELEETRQESRNAGTVAFQLGEREQRARLEHLLAPNNHYLTVLAELQAARTQVIQATRHFLASLIRIRNFMIAHGVE